MMNQDEDRLTLNAALDGELGVERSVELQARLAKDPALRAEWERQRALRAAIRAGATYHDVPAPLRARIAKTVAAHSAPAPAPAVRPAQRLAAALGINIGRRRWSLAVASALASAVLTSSVTWHLMADRTETRALLERTAEDAVSAHTRARMTDRLIDVASSDQHQVKPWLSERLPYSPAVPDLSAHGFELVGARRDVLDGEVVAALVYRRRLHTITAFVRPFAGAISGDPAQTRVLRGFNVVEFTQGAMNYWIVSDLNARELGDFVELLKAGG